MRAPEPDQIRLEPPSGLRAALSRQEARVLALAMDGAIDRQIADDMGISLGTVRVYWKRIRGKSGGTRSESIAGLARRESGAAGERAARVYESALRAMGVPFAVVEGASGRTLRAEAAFAALLGAAEEELVGCSLAAWLPEMEGLPPSTAGAALSVGCLEIDGRGRRLVALGERESVFVVWL